MRAGDIVVKTIGLFPDKGLILCEDQSHSSPIGPKYWKVLWFGPERIEAVECQSILEVLNEER